MKRAETGESKTWEMKRAETGESKRFPKTIRAVIAVPIPTNPTAE